MIPILYPGNETQFNKNGLGPLADAISCVVEEERNGQYELHMTYPVTGVHYADLQETRIILAKPFDGGTAQPFIIYKISRPMDGIVTVDAEHISYRLNGTVVMPFSSSGIISLFSTDLPGHIVGTSPFTFQTDITSADGYSVDLPREVRGVLGGEQDSILQKYGGEWEFNRFNCYLHAARGSDNNVTLRYGKNITDINSVIDMTSVYTGIVPYWTNENETVTLTEKVVMSSHASDYPFNIVKTVDFSSNFETAPTETQLRNVATAYVNNNEGWKLKNNIEVSFVALWETEQYKNIAPLERVKLCDLVTVIYEPLGVNFKTKVIATEYNVLTEKYNKITLGEQSFTLGAIIEESVTESEVQTTSRMRNAIERATKLIQGGLGGHVVFSTNADGEPEEILIMDTDDIGTATNVIRMNLAGIGFSDSGYMGPFDTAWTIDGHFVADFIDTGKLNADLVKTGILGDVLSYNYWNMLNGNFRLGAENGTKDGIKLNNGTLVINGTYITAGEIDATKVTVKNLDASKITSGSINASVISVTNLNASNITSGTLDASVVSVTNLNASNITSGSINASVIGVTNLNASNITTGEMSANRIKGGTLQLGAVSGYTDGALSVNMTNGSATLDKTGFTMTNTRWSSTTTMSISEGHITVKKGSYPGIDIDVDGTGGIIKVQKNTTTSADNVTIDTSGIGMTGSSSSYTSSLAPGSISLKGNSYSADMLYINDSNTNTSGHNSLNVTGWSSLPKIRGGAVYFDSTHVGFFGKTSGATKSTVNKATTGTSATASDCASVINSLLTALKDYGLINSN